MTKGSGAVVVASVPALVFLSFALLVFPVDAWQQQQILLDVKAALTDPQSVLSNWTTGSDCCQWKGIRCNPEGRVVAVDVSSLNVSGPFPAQLTKLSSLRSLNISNNALIGGLPANISELRNLQVLDAYNNNLTGPLPVSLSRLRGLKYLDLGGNYFDGAIPEEYGDLGALQYLGLHGNSLASRIPASLGRLRELKTLLLGYYNSFDGGIPPEMGNLSKLEHLDISNCNISGDVPPQLGQLRNLKVLFLHTNGLSGPLPRELGGLAKLQSLDVSYNNLQGEIPPEFQGLKELRLLNLFINALHGGVPDFLTELKNLEVLQLWQNNFTGSLPKRLGSNGPLKMLDVSTNKLVGGIPPDLCSGGMLQVLVLMNNWFMGPIPKSLGRCRSLVRVRMGQNYLNGTIPPSLLYLPQLSFLELGGNYIGGALPNATALPQTSKLGHVDISNNRFTGVVPESVGLLSGLQILLAGGNQLTGTIPECIGKLQSLNKLDLSGNHFSGSIPKEIAQCRALTYVDLSRNDLSGGIPEELCGMRRLDYLNVSRNRLSGSVSGRFALMHSLTAADFSYNNLTGPVPDAGQFASFNASAFEGNPGLCGQLLAACPVRTDSRIFSEHEGKPSASMKLALALGVMLCSLLLMAIAIAKARAAFSADRTRESLTTFQKVDFTADDVRDCVKDDNVIGRGGAGVVYRGLMPNGLEVAIKKLCVHGTGSKGSAASSRTKNDRGFAAEIETVGNIRHRNIVRLLAVCSDRDSRLLVYEYMANGSVGDLLHGPKGGHLHWQTRYKIALDAARGLAYLHHDCSPVIVHRDVKSTNILLDSNFEAHVADFGLAKFLFPSSDMSAVAGSYGYIAPEYAYTLKVDEKSDVYSYGVVVLELITGKKAVGDAAFGEGVNIVQWVRKTRTRTRTSKRPREAEEETEGKSESESEGESLKMILDPRLSSVPAEEAQHLLFVALLCAHESSVERPTMREVVQMLSERPAPKTRPRQYLSPASQSSPRLRPPSSIPPPPTAPTDLDLLLI